MPIAPRPPLATTAAAALAGACALAVVASGGAARADPPPGDAVARLEVEREGAAAERCPDAAALGAAIDAVARRPAAIAGGAGGDVDLRVTFAPSGGGFRATLRAAGARSGERVLDDPADGSCGAIAAAVAVATVVLLDARAAEPAAPAPPPSAPPPPAPPLPPPSARPPAFAAPASRSSAAAAGDDEPDPAGLALGAPSTWSVDVAALASTAVTPEGGVEIGAWARRRLGPVSVGIGARVAPPSDHPFANGTVAVWALRGAAEGCVDWSDGAAVTLSPCATFAAGAMIAHGRRFDRSDAGVLPTLAVGGAAVGAFGVGARTAVLVRLGVAGAPVRPAFEVEDDGGASAGEFGEAYRAPAIATDAGAGLRLAFD